LCVIEHGGSPTRATHYTPVLARQDLHL
jgi:hypothetical protein